uniref:Malic enzyme n=1 Tax=Syphacia muris TaxID=451379 RepID=A0A0N5ATC1_9BILA
KEAHISPAHITIRLSSSTSSKHNEDLYNTPDVKHMSEDELSLYKLYRPERITPSKRSLDLLKTPYLNKGMAFSLYERQYLGIHGLIPPAFMTQEQQAYRVICKLREQPNDLARYIQLDGLQDRNEKLFYRILCDHVQELMPIVYTPTVGLACQNFGYIYRHPKGVYITINDNSISKIHQILCNWPETDVRSIVVTDGERILGLGDLGAYGIGIPVGKLALYVALGGLQPRQCLPILLDVGTDNDELLNDPFYIGLRHKRIRGKQYDTLIENFMKACAKRFGQKTLIQFEDFGNQNAYRLLNKFQDRYTMFNDDIQGTASVVVAGVMACTRVTKIPLSQEKFVFLGAGTAATGVAEMCVRHMQTEGLSEQEAIDRIYMMDIDGLITKERCNHSTDRNTIFAKDMPPTKDLLEVVKTVKPGILIGASTVRGAFTEEIIRAMAEFNERPIIFALSNPTSKSECTAEEAFRYTDGRVLFASGSPFPEVNMNGKTYKPGQGNNAYIFPGVALGVTLFQVRHIDNDMFLLAAKKVASCVTAEDLSCGRIYPRLKEIREISVHIAMAIGEYAYEKGLANLYPRPSNMEKYIRACQYKTNYDELINAIYDWPKADTVSNFPVPGTKRDDEVEVD